MNKISKLIGHQYIFNDLIYLDQSKKLPNKILLNGPKGIGKKLLLNHLLNYLYSKNNENFIFQEQRIQYKIAYLYLYPLILILTFSKFIKKRIKRQLIFIKLER